MMLEDLYADAKLDDAIQFPEPVSENWQTPSGVFLTGSTGFLGVYLLAALLARTEADIYCLVRAENTQMGAQRIRQRMQFYQLWNPEFEARIIPIPGDLSLPSFGLSEQAFLLLAEMIEVIYHNGAQVNAMYPYARLRKSNVLGTLEVLRLAGLKHTKPVNFISTLAVFFSDVYVNQEVKENDFASLDDGLKGGYKQSKWVAETLFHKARERGLPTIIHRPGRILGDSRTGIVERLSDLLGNLLQGCLQMGQYPNVDTVINVAPVDYVSQAIVYLGQKNANLNQNFHLCNPRSTAWNSMWESLYGMGYKLTASDFSDWSKATKLRVKYANDKKLYLILQHLLRSPIYLFSAKPEFATKQTVAALVGSEISCPPMDISLLTTYLNYFQQQGSVPVLPQRTIAI